MADAIMFVDDEENILNSLRRVFRREPYEVITCPSAEEALKVLESREVKVLITDQLMPGMKGTELLRVVKQKYPLTIRIVLSGHSDMLDIISAINEGEIYRFLKKPDDLTDLVGTVARAMEQSHAVRQIAELVTLYEQKTEHGKKYHLHTCYSSGFLKVELNSENILDQKQVLGILNHIISDNDQGHSLDIAGGVIVNQKGRMTLYADLKSGFQLVLEMPIEKKNG